MRGIRKMAGGVRAYLRLVIRPGEYKKYNLKHNLLDLFSHRKRDDFYWGFYTDHYVEELKLVSRAHTISLKPADYSMDAAVLSRKADIPPLHPNYRLVYETILQLAPSKVLEVGCGRGDHLHNLSVLSPELDLYGVDISRRQIELLKKTYPDLQARVGVFDMSHDRASLSFPDVDVVYTQAVLMHIQEQDRYKKALQNIFSVVRDAVVLMENWTRHDFLSDIEKLRAQGCIRWPEIRYYYRDSPELQRPHLMVVASRDLPYKNLSDYSLLRSQTDTGN